MTRINYGGKPYFLSHYSESASFPHSMAYLPFRDTFPQSISFCQFCVSIISIIKDMKVD
jgi:hypothetical protein